MKPSEFVIREHVAARRVHRGRLFRKYFLLILLLVCGTLVISGGIGLYFAYQENKVALASLQREKAGAAAARIEEFVRQVEQQLAFAALPHLGAEGVEQRNLEFQKVLRIAQAVTDIAYMDEHGREQLVVSRLQMNVIGSGKDRSQEPAFKEARPGQTWFGPVYFRKDTEPYITMAIRSKQAGPVTAADVNLKFIWDVVTRIKIGQKGKAYVVDATGHLVADPDIGLVLRKTNLSHLEQVQKALAPDADDAVAMLAKDFSGNSVLTAHAPIEPAREQRAQGTDAGGLGWKVFVEQPVSEVFAALDATILRTIALLLAGLLFSALAALSLARSMVRPISTLQEGAARIGAGDLEQKIEVHTGDELETLADQFNEMSAQLRESYAGLERKVEERTAELQQTLEQQTATSEILKVIASSPSDEQPVFEAIIAHAGKIAGGCSVNVTRLMGDKLHLAAYSKVSPQADEALKSVYPVSATDVGPLAEAVRRKSAFSVGDFEADPNISRKAREVMRARGFRSTLYVPIVRGEVVYGVMHVSKVQPGPFPERWINMLQIFADQAVIAIENVRLFNETKEALEQQTATAEILKVISSSTTNTQPVFEAIVQSGLKLFPHAAVMVGLPDGAHIRLGAIATADSAQAEGIRSRFPIPLTREYMHATAILDRRLIDVPDAEHSEEAALAPGIRNFIATGSRAITIMPMLRGDAAIGTISVTRRTAGPLSQKQIALLRTFADQAVIAIENVRLFNETKESLERQTATADVLRVISGSPTDVQPVFEAILEKAIWLCDAHLGGLFLQEPDGAWSMASYRGDDPSVQEAFQRLQAGPHTGLGKLVRLRRPVHIPDLLADSDTAKRDPLRVLTIEKLRARTFFAVPLLKEGAVIGAVVIYRREVRPFSEPQIRLVTTFADQAVIAIENVRLFNETKEALEQQTATSDILQVTSKSPTDVKPVFDTILANTLRLCEGSTAVLWTFDGQKLHIGAHRNMTEGAVRHLTENPLEPGDWNPTAQAALERRTIHVLDVFAEPGYRPLVPSGTTNTRPNAGTVLAVPLMRYNELVGVITVWRYERKLFSEKQLDMVNTFAAQAVIAIENVRLFNETKESLEQQTAIAEVLRVISSSPTDVKPVLDAVAVRAARICDADDARIFLVDGNEARHTAGFGNIPMHIKLGQSRPLDRGWGTGRAILDRTPVHIHDQLAAASEYPVSQSLHDVSGVRTALSVPLMRESRALGAIVLRRLDVRPFSEKQVGLLKTFSDQAAIAIENVRLFNATQEALEQQTATAEVLSVISGSITDAHPVFDAISRSVLKLYGARHVALYVRVGDKIDRVGYAVADKSADDGSQSLWPIPLDDKSLTGRAILGGDLVHIKDTETEPGLSEQSRKIIRKTGVRSVLLAPMQSMGVATGTLSVARRAAGGFTDREVELLRTFADQAVIAMENVRLFREIQEKGAQLEVANKHKSDFLANMSHELRTPLNAIIGFSEVLIERMFGEVNEKQADYLKDIHESGKHLLSLINDILDLSKIEAGRMDLEISTFDLPSALSNAMTLVRERAQRHGIALGLDVDPRLGEFRADERKFKQIVLNLLSNAVKFTPDGGRVNVSAKLDTDKVEIAVKDTGIGIAPEDHAAVFEEFKQVGRDYTRKAEGTGLGLALTKRFVELHGGGIRLESAPGQGSTFTITLPLTH